MPVFGIDRVSRFLAGLSRKGAGGATNVRVMDVNGEPALVLEARDSVITVMTIELDAECKNLPNFNRAQSGQAAVPLAGSSVRS